MDIGSPIGSIMRFDEDLAQALPNLRALTPETSTQEMLLHMVGRYVIAELLIYPGTFYIREGILMQITKNYFLLYDESANSRVACDISTLSMMTVFPAGVRLGHMSEENKCRYIEQLKQSQLCRMQPIPAACVAPTRFSTGPNPPPVPQPTGGQGGGIPMITNSGITNG